MIRLRRISQALFFAAFLYLLVRTGSRIDLALRLDPLAAIANVAATGALYRGLLWSLIVLVPTLIFGRFFCGWVCPLGTIHHFFSSRRSGWKRGPRRLASNRYQRWQTAKYWILALVLGSALAGATLPMALDPISFLARSLAVSILPALDRVSAALPYPVDLGLRFVLLGFRPPHFQQALLIGLMFLAVVVLNLWITRFWCRAICPLGALLGVASRWSILGLEKNRDRCGDCNRCTLDCQGGDDPIPGAKWRKAECHVCLNCVGSCPEGSLRFRLFPNNDAAHARTDLRRRHALTAVAAGFAIAPLMRAAPASRPIRPPGALDEEALLSRCIRCGACMKACPNNALQPAVAEAGAEGFWTPVLIARIGFCEPNCVACGDVCPTGSIWPFTNAQKGWEGSSASPIRIGTAFIDRGRCLAWAMGTECIVCEEWCPTSPKAISLRPAPDSNVRQPYVDPQRCVGCGACEFACPVRTTAAVYVTSVGESRSKTNQILLKPHKPATTTALPATAGPWTRSSEVRVYAADDLWRYIDGDADRYLRAGVRRTSTAHYRGPANEEAVADAHEFSTADAASRFFESEPSAGSASCSVGDQCRHYGQMLVFRRGAFLFRLTAYDDSPALREALIALANALRPPTGN